MKKLIRDDKAPSIQDALAGKLKNEIDSSEKHTLNYADKGDVSLFTADELKEKWDEYVEKLTERPNLKSTLSKVPAIGDNFNLILEVDNSVQEDLIESIKPELIAWLRKELKNSKIELGIKIIDIEQKNIIYSDSDKYIEMAKKNPMLDILKQKFRLDFE